MDWIERLNREATGRLPLLFSAEVCLVEVSHWAHSAALTDNVPHRHTFFEVCLVGEYGRGIYRVGDAELLLAPGDLFIARPGVLHQIRNTGDRLMELSWVSFVIAPASAPPLSPLRRFAESSNTLVVPERVHGLSPCWNAGLREVAQTPSSAPASVVALASALVTAIVHSGTDGDSAGSPDERVPRQSPNERLARVAVRYIHDNLNRPISVGEVAAQIHVSPRHLTRILETFAGIAPAGYIERARMDRAATLLTRSSLPIKEIAGAVGYGTVHHFTRVFKRVQKETPGVFRRKGGEPIWRGENPPPEGALV